jgi:hypothetical protein
MSRSAGEAVYKLSNFHLSAILDLSYRWVVQALGLRLSGLHVTFCKVGTHSPKQEDLLRWK